MGANLTSSEIKVGYKDANEAVKVKVQDTIKIEIDHIDLDLKSNLSQWFFLIKNTHSHINAQFTDLTLDLEISLDTQASSSYEGALAPAI
jgi:hypothetical protein